MVLDALHAGDERALVAELLRQGDVEAAAAALLAALPSSLHCKDIYLQVRACLHAWVWPQPRAHCIMSSPDTGLSPSSRHTV